MSIIIDLIIIGVISLSTFIGYKQGLIKSAIKIFTFIIAIVLALVLYKPVSNVIINNTQIDDNIESFIVEKINPNGVDENEQLDLKDTMKNSIISTTNNTIKGIAETFSIKIIESSVIFIIFILVKIALRFVSVLSDTITKLPIIKQFNKLGGTIYGIGKGIIIAYIAFALILMATPLINIEFINSINNSILGSMFYNNNLLLNIIV